MAHKRAQVTEEGAKATLGSGGILDRIGDTPATVELRDLPLEQIQPNPFQPRQHFAPEGLEELAAAIRVQGFYGHLVVRPHGRAYQLAYGERRLRATKLAGLATIPVQIRELSNNEMMEIALTENVLRENLHPVEEARGYWQLQETMGYSVRQIAEKIGKSKSYVATLLSLLRYPDLEEAVRTADIPVRTAEELAKIEDTSLRNYYIEQVASGKLNRNQLIDELTQRRAPTFVRTADIPVQTAEELAKIEDTSLGKYDTEQVVSGKLNRNQLIDELTQRRDSTFVRTADRQVPVPTAITRAYQTLERQQIEQVKPNEKVQTILLLQQIIAQASHLLEELEKI